mmetsp:Transcript_19577/g.27691  ORF Transcript_19577/g.27691 Transcript_19577/m.27691 type:complete len:377 (-) Transcript_19577:260-1390(-)
MMLPMQESGRILFDSLCQWGQCFGLNNNCVTPTDAIVTNLRDDEKKGSRHQRRQSRTESSTSLHSQATKKRSGNKERSSRQQPSSKNMKSQAAIGHAQDVASAKTTANQIRLTCARTRTCKKEDIFRTKENTASYHNRRCQRTPAKRNQNVIRNNDNRKNDNNRNSREEANYESCSATSLGGVAHYALCFATPIRGSSAEEMREGTASIPLTTSETFEDESTLNTCEETISSTLYFDAKIAHMQETRPPMPLFNKYKVNTDASLNELQRIVSSDSHRSFEAFNSDKDNEKHYQEILKMVASNIPTRPGIVNPPRKQQPMAMQKMNHKIITKLDYSMADTHKHHVSTPMTLATSSSSYSCHSDQSLSCMSTSIMAEI